MKNNEKDTKSSIEEVNERRIDQITELMDNYTRTERHLEQYSHIGSKQNLDNARKIQVEREKEIEHLKNLVAYGDKENSCHELENLERNYKYTDGYMKENKDHMDEETLKNTQEKQKNRLEQLDNLRD